MSVITKHPKLSWLIIGLIIGGIMAYIVGRSAKQTASIYKEQIAKLEIELSRSEYDYSQLSATNKELSKRLKEEVIEIVRADGSKETRRKTDSSEDSSEQQITQLRIKYEQDLAKVHAEYQNREIINNKLGLGLLYDLSGSRGIIGSYDVYPNIGIGGGAVLDQKVLDNIFIFGIIKF
jgi:IS1 family transposase